MENNFPINEDLAYEKIRDLMFDMMEEDPNRFYALTDKLNELAALPKRTMTLVLDLMAATPFQVIIPKHVRKNDPDTFKADHETVSNGNSQAPCPIGLRGFVPSEPCDDLRW